MYGENVEVMVKKGRVRNVTETVGRMYLLAITVKTGVETGS